MKKILLYSCIVAGVICFASCNSNDKAPETETVDPEGDAAVRDMLKEDAEKDKRFSKDDLKTIDAFSKDKTTISPADLDQKDKEFISMEKNLYVSDANDNMAIVFGIKPKGKASVAIVQKEGGNASTLKQTGDLNADNPTFSDGKLTLEIQNDGVILVNNGKKEHYKPRD